MRRKPVEGPLRDLVFLRSNGQCEQCQQLIHRETFHAGHIRAVASGGATVLENLLAQCVRCNLTLGARDLGDPRLPPRAWQLEGLTDPDIPLRIIQTGIATVAAAPGAGKTFFSGLVFETLRQANLVDRLVVLAPTVSLVEQWKTALLRDAHLDLTTNEAHERRDSDGCIVTYQSLNALSVRVHRACAGAARTLLVLDEVHHVGESNWDTGQRYAWARYVTDIAGEIGALHVMGVLNISGTMWRSSASQRISTVRYDLDPETGRYASAVDLNIPVDRLIREQQLRPVDLWKVGAQVDLVDLVALTRTVGATCDLEEPGPARAILRGLPKDPTWRARFTDTIIRRLRWAYQDLGGAPVKGLIVAATQEDARAFQATANAQMRAAGLRPFTEIAISDDPDAARTLTRFKTAPQCGILCTVNMAGEGYDCPSIIVVGYATNKLTPLYIRQVVARAQRVTEVERQRHGRPLPAAIIIPDVPELVELMQALLRPMRHELALADPERERGRHDGPAPLRYQMQAVHEVQEGDAHVTGVEDGAVDLTTIRLVEPYVEAAGLAVTHTPRIIHAVRHAMRAKRDTTDFDPLTPEEQAIAEAPPAPAPVGRVGVHVEGLAETDSADIWQRQLHVLERWWRMNGNTPIESFASQANTSAGILTGQRAQATRAQLTTAYEWARTQILDHCQRTGQTPPRLLEPPR
jgi:superfamily II DNA or RNA helicase